MWLSVKAARPRRRKRKGHTMNINETGSATGHGVSRRTDARSSGKRVLLAAVATIGVAVSGLAAFELGGADLPAPVANPAAAASPAVASTASGPTSTAIALDFCVGPPDARGQLRPITLQICISDGHDGWRRGGGYGGGRGRGGRY